MKLRTDHGTENVLVARHMLETRGVSSKPVITGKSVHNQRIERLWVDVFIYVTQQFWNTFHFIEAEHELDPDNELHLFALHYVYKPRLNKMLREFSESWNNHGVRTERNRTPLQIWTEGFYKQGSELIEMTAYDLSQYGIDYDGPLPTLQTANNVEIPEVNLPLSQECIQSLTSMDPLENDGNYGIDVFLRIVTFLEENICK